MLTQIEIYVIDKVKDLRVENKMSQADLAFKLGVSSGFIGKIESKKFNSKYNLNHINKISKIFNISPQIFLPEKNL